MSEKRAGARDASVAAATDADEPTRAELQRQMEAAREDINETVAEIREVVTQQYEGVRDGLNEVLDWGEHFNKNPIVWGAGAVSVGILIGIGLSHAFEDTSAAGRRRRKTHVSSLGEHLVGQVSGLADAVLPTLTGKVKEMFGVDLSAYLPGVAEEKPARRRVATGRTAAKRAAPKRVAAKRAGGATKKSGAGKSGAKKRGGR